MSNATCPGDETGICGNTKFFHFVFADTVKEVYDRIVESIKVKRSAPPNAWLWSLTEKCKSRDDIKLLFDILQQLRVFVSFSELLSVLFLE